MKMGCLLGHTWNGCRCARCGKTRDEGHSYQPVPNACWVKCAFCGKEQNIKHDWQGCTCSRCGRLRATGHDYQAEEGTPVVRCARCHGTAIRMNDIAQTDMQAIFTALEAAGFTLARSQIMDSMTADKDALSEIETALEAAANKVNPFNMNVATGVMNGSFGQMTYADLLSLSDKTQTLIEVIRQKQRLLSGQRTSAAAGPAFNREAYLEQLRREGKITDEKIERMNRVKALRPQVTDFATYVNLSLDESELDEMEQKLLAEDDIGSQAVFQFLYDCGMGRMGNGVMWWKQAKRLTRMLVKFQDPKLKDQLTLLANLADRTNVWEYHTEIANVAKEELEKLG